MQDTWKLGYWIFVIATIRERFLMEGKMTRWRKVREAKTFKNGAQIVYKLIVMRFI